MFSALNKTEYIRIRAGITKSKSTQLRSRVRAFSPYAYCFPLLPSYADSPLARPAPAFPWPRLSPWPCRSLARLDLELRHRRHGGWQLQPAERAGSIIKERASNILPSQHFLTGKGRGVGKPAKAGVRPWPLEQGQQARHQHVGVRGSSRRRKGRVS